VPTSEALTVKLDQESAERHQSLSSLLKKDLRATLLFLAPAILGSDFDPELAARKLGLTLDSARSIISSLFALGLWRRGPAPDQQIIVAREHLQLGDLSVSEFMTMNLFLAARLESDGPCWYESYSVATDETTKREFIREINQAFKRFVQRSREVEADRVVCWNHISVDFKRDLQEMGLQDRWEGL
jgi:hypothetical protein